MEPENEPKPSNKFGPFIKFGGMVFQMLAVILLAAWAGSWLDDKYQTPKPYWTLGLAFAGVILSMVMVIRDVRKTK
jgi:ATP synthase protein I